MVFIGNLWFLGYSPNQNKVYHFFLISSSSFSFLMEEPKSSLHGIKLLLTFLRASKIVSHTYKWLIEQIWTSGNVGISIPIPSSPSNTLLLPYPKNEEVILSQAFLRYGGNVVGTFVRGKTLQGLSFSFQHKQRRLRLWNTVYISKSQNGC